MILLFTDYFNSLESDEEDFDWMHINSLSLIGDDSLILSSRETSSIIKISDIYGSPTVDYLISSDQFWEGTGYEDLLLEQVGDFTLQAGQHCVTYETSDELSDGQYYLTMYNNNNATISTRDYDYDSDENYDGTYSGTEGDESYYYKYLVDETAGTFTLVDSVPVTYSGYVSSVQQVGDEAGVSKDTVRRFIRLTELIPELLDMVDQKQIAFNPAVELSFLKPEEQKQLLEAMDYAQATPSLSQAQRLKKYSQEGKCTFEVMCTVMDEEKKTDLDRVIIKQDVLRKYFPKSYTPKQMEDTIIRLLEQWQRKKQREQER